MSNNGVSIFLAMLEWWVRGGSRWMDPSIPGMTPRPPPLHHHVNMLSQVDQALAYSFRLQLVTTVDWLEAHRSHTGIANIH